ncbi:hypothetical protein COU80_02365 [Candidatus Peregrinibacteria bacterium CG10_big_fil_rev_8_21_14_0_10_55_24]|nr:MAG: hypothetical protein COU80_02365 [Candidatus Peregrinibacteria bacterium CG10_big_fil_rev_8_21_14_0_10_55_24]
MNRFFSNVALAALSATIPSVTLAYSVESMPYLRANSCTRLNNESIGEIRVSDRRCAEQKLAATKENLGSQTSTKKAAATHTRTRTQNIQSVVQQRIQTTERRSARVLRQETETHTRAARLQQWKSE